MPAQFASILVAPLDTAGSRRSSAASMLVRNYAKPFCIAGIILAEIYMLLVMLAPYGHEGRPLPAPIPMDETLAPGAPIPIWYLVTRILVGSIFFGPLGALVGLGLGLVFSGFMQWFRGRGK